jgi:carbonic anhydrase/acetyltransferase-like protein (isoleucine patch superfamily)
VRIFLPEKKIQLVRDPAEVEQAKRMNPPGMPDYTVGPNVSTSFITHISHPRIHQLAYVHRQASVIGAVEIEPKVFVAPQASIRGDEGQDIFVGEESAVLDGAVLHGLATEQGGIFLERNQVRVMGQRYSIYIGSRVTLSQQSQVYGPSIVGDDTFVGQQAMVLRSMVGKRCVLEPRAAVIDVTVPDGHYVPAGVVVRNQTQAEILPVITGDYPLRDANSQAVEVNTALAEGYIAMYPRAATPPEEGH